MVRTMSDREQPAGEANLSRRALLLAGAALVAAGCASRTSLNRMDDIPMRPTSSGSGNGGPKPPSMPIKPPAETVAGNGYTLVPRKAWTSLPVKSNHNPMGTVTRITVHHTGEHGSWDNLPDTEIVQRIESYHRNEKDWAAIGYHFLVGKDGRVYEGRPAQYQGAHTSTQNENNLGISVIGDFMNRPPSSRQLAALKAFLDDKRSEYGVGRGRIYGHRDLHASLCPGDALYAWVKTYKAGQA
jgi:N-acetylmuramoyl-L-alanine amidase